MGTKTYQNVEKCSLLGPKPRYDISSPLRHGLTSPTCPEKESRQLLTLSWLSWNLTTKQPLGLYRSIIMTSQYHHGQLNILNMWISTSYMSWLFINGRTSIHAHLNIFEGKIKFKDDKIALTLSSRICQLDHHSSLSHPFVFQTDNVLGILRQWL